MLDNTYTPIFTIGFIVWIGIMITVGYFTSRGKNDGSSFLTGGAAFPFFLTFATIGATMIGAGSSMGAVGNGFKSGWAGALYGIGLVLGLFILATFSSSKNKGFMTMSEEAQYFYGGKKIIRQLMGFMMFIAEIIWLGNSINGGSIYLQYVTGLDPVLCKCITLLGFAVYVFVGGYYAVVTTDAVQFIVLVLGFFIIALRALPMAGGFANIASTFAAAGKPGAMSFFGIEAYGLMPALALVSASLCGVVGSPTCRTRIYTAKNEQTARKALLGQSGFLFVWAFITAIIGMSCFTIMTMNGDAIESSDFAFAYMATHVLGPVLGLFFMIAGMSATMSSGDSDAIAGVTILLTDVYPSITGKRIKEEDYQKSSRIALLITLLISFVITLFAKDVITYISTIIGAFLPGLACAMILGKYWKRSNWQGGVACILTGTIFGCLVLFIPAFSSFVTGIFGGPAIPAFLLSMISCVIVSLLTPADPTTELEALEYVMNDRYGIISKK